MVAGRRDKREILKPAFPSIGKELLLPTIAACNFKQVFYTLYCWMKINCTYSIRCLM